VAIRERIQADDLPAGSVVADAEIAVFRLLDGPGFVWRGTGRPARLNDARVNALLAAGAHILRTGYEQRS
jgi:hypothetical protein